MVGNFVEDVLEVVTFGSCGLEGVGLNDKECIAVEVCYLCGFPCEFVMLDMTVPLGNDLGDAALYH